MQKQRRDEAASERYHQEHARCLSMVVREMRVEKGLTIEELARRAQVSVRWIEKLEANQRGNYRMARLLQVVFALGLEAYDFYKRVDEMVGPPPWLRKKARNG